MRTAATGEIRVRCERGGEGFALVPGSELGAGGQATVYPAPGIPDRVAKLYHAPTDEQERKLRLMLARRPSGAQGIFAWPLDLLRDEEGRFTGLLLPRVEGKLRLFELYNPATRRDRAPLFHHGLLHRAARNLAAAFHKLHEAGFVVGDVNESNVLVGEDGRVVLIDTDSFQVRDPATGTVFRCPVGRPEFTPPELRERSFAETDRAPEHDRFGLGVLVFQMLMEGTHPFAGRFRGEGEPPPVQERIAAGHFPYSGRADVPLDPPRTAPPLATLDPALRALLLRCFEDGHRDPAARPDAAEWRDALAAAEASLATCERNEQHMYGEHLDACPWCERARRLEGRDPFPSVAAVRRGEHRPRHAPARAPRHGAPAVAAAGTGSLTAPLPTVLLGAALLVALLGAIAPAFPPLVLALITGALLFAGNRSSRGGRLAPWATALTLVLVMIGFAGSWRLDPWPELEPTPVEVPDVEPLPIAGVGDLVTPLDAFAYGAGALDAQPVPLDTIGLAEAVAGLPHPGESAEAVLRFVLDPWGEVDPETVDVLPDPGTYALGLLRDRLEDIRFRPGEREGGPVRSEVWVPIRWSGGVMRPDFAGASWNGGGEGLAQAPYAAGVADVADAEVKPRLLNADEVQGVLAELYPPLLRDAGVTGSTSMKFVVDREGNVQPASVVVVSTTHEKFAEASAAVAARMRFSPAEVEGRTVPVLVQIPIAWTLERG